MLILFQSLHVFINYCENLRRNVLDNFVGVSNNASIFMSSPETKKTSTFGMIVAFQNLMQLLKTFLGQH